MNVPPPAFCKTKQIRLCLRDVTGSFNRMALKMMFQIFFLIFLGFFQNSISIDNDIEIEPRFGNLSDVLGFKIFGGQESSNVPMAVSTLTFLVYTTYYLEYFMACKFLKFE